MHFDTGIYDAGIVADQQRISGEKIDEIGKPAMVGIAVAIGNEQTAIFAVGQRMQRDSLIRQRVIEIFYANIFNVHNVSISVAIGVNYRIITR